MLHPSATHEFATQHDACVKWCFEQLLHNPVSDDAWSIATLPLTMGGLGLRSACRGRHVFYWANWTDVLHMVRLRHPFVAESVLAGLANNHPGHHLHGAATAPVQIGGHGFPHPLARGLRPEGFPVEEEVGPRHVGWQRVATVEADNFFKVTAVWPRLNVASRALLRSQAALSQDCHLFVARRLGYRHHPI